MSDYSRGDRGRPGDADLGAALGVAIETRVGAERPPRPLGPVVARARVLTRRRRTRRGLAVVAAASVVLVVAFIASDTGSSTPDVFTDRVPPATTSTLDPAAPSTIPITDALFPIELSDETAYAPWDVLGWGIVAVDDPELLANDVALVVHPRLMAYTLGSVFNTVWTSGDGITWSQVLLPSTVEGPRECFQVVDAAVGGLGLVAVGHGLSLPTGEYFIEPGETPESPVDGCIPEGIQLGAVWTSPDGKAWTRLPSDPVFEDAKIFGVASNGDSLVAVGFHQESDNALVGHSVVWTSPDGVTWTRIPQDEELFGNSVMYDVVHGPGGYVAVGWALPKADPDRSIYWLSLDGREWTRIPLPEELRVTLPHALMVDDLGYYAAVIHRDGNGPDWRSNDGVTWTQVPASSFGGSP